MATIRPRTVGEIADDIRSQLGDIFYAESRIDDLARELSPEMDAPVIEEVGNRLASLLTTVEGHHDKLCNRPISGCTCTMARIAAELRECRDELRS